ncbi:MAG: 50S ribosomal protein L13 [Chlamydiae bacterium]|nr:50S ribosomal protein L13 [Chlamydiota bacterium]
MKSQKTTYMAKPEEQKLTWFLLDAEGKTLGRLATEVANILRGKHKPTFTPHVNTGDGVVVVNAEKVKVSGSKEAQKLYRHYTGYIGGLKETPYRVMKERKPEYILEHAIKGMLPKTKLGRAIAKRLRIYKGTEHTMQAQQPITVDI